MNNITVSNLPNITFYTGEGAEVCGNALENRNYGFESDYFGTLSMNNNYNSYWSDMANSTFSENPTNYSNIGDILNATISYINKFKNNDVDIQINKNILTFNYNYKTDLFNEYENANIIPASQIIDLLVNINDMTFNKKAYYKKNYELLDVTYARKKYPYNPDGTIFNVTDEDNEIVTYDFSKQFVDYNYVENEHYNTYTRSYMIEMTLDIKEFNSFKKWVKLYENPNDPNLINFVSYNDSEANRIYATGAIQIDSTMIDDKSKIIINSTSNDDLYTKELYLNSEYGINNDSIYELYTYDYKVVYEPDPVNTYIEVAYYYTYEIYDINELSNRINTFFKNNTDKVENEYGDLKTYYISELDTMLPLTLNTYSLSSKNLYAYFNFISEYDNWFDNNISFDMVTTGLSNDTNLLTILPLNENWFNVIINNNDKPCGSDINKNSEHTFKIVDNTLLTEENTKFKIINPSNIKKIDLSENIDKIKKLDLINSYKKKTDIYNSVNTNWIIENGQHIESLILGNQSKEGIIENIIGINNLTNLKELDITNCNKIKKDFSIGKLSNLNIFKAAGSNIKNFVPRSGNHFTEISLPDTLQTLTLRNNLIDSFDYTPSEELINVTLENVRGEGLNTQQFVEDWIELLSTTKIDEGTSKETTMLLDGIITNTNLTGIDWTNFEVNTLLKFKYLGLNNFSGKIQIKGSGENNTLTRKEYLNLIDTFGEEIMETWDFKDVINSKPIKFEYTLNQDIFKKNIYLYYFDNQDEVWLQDVYGVNDDLIHKITITDSIGGHALLDIFDQLELSKGMIQFKLNSEGFGYEYTLNKKISLNNKNLTKNLTSGDIVLYKGNKLILVRQNITVPYNYVKIGKIEMQNPLLYKYPAIVVSFDTTQNIAETLLRP